MHGNTIFPKLVTAALEHPFKPVNWKQKDEKEKEH